MGAEGKGWPCCPSQGGIAMVGDVERDLGPNPNKLSSNAPENSPEPTGGPLQPLHHSSDIIVFSGAQAALVDLAGSVYALTWVRNTKKRTVTP